MNFLSRFQYIPVKIFMAQVFSFQNKSYQLNRFPIKKNDPFQAWNAADEYLLNAFETKHVSRSKNVLLINDSFGCLSTCLNNYSRTVWTDSITSKTSIENNLVQNGYMSSGCTIEPMTDISETVYDTVLFRIPKTRSLLEFQLSLLTARVHSETVVIAGGMSKEIHHSTLQLFERYLGKTITSHAQKKARLIFPTIEKPAMEPLSYSVYRLEETNYEIINYPNVFSKEKLDMGTRELIPFIPELPEAEKIADLGCGAGVLSLIASAKNPNAKIIGLDDSYLAVQSATETFRTNEKTNGSFLVSNIFSECPEQTFDLILCNPPFHQGNLIVDDLAWKMFTQSKRYLSKNGQLIIVGNNHLGYGSKLKKLFRSVEVVHQSTKFTILRSKK